VTKTVHNLYTFDEAAAQCPTGFGIPTAEDFLPLFSGCAIDPEIGYKCDYCESSPICNKTYAGSFGTVYDSTLTVWTTDTCVCKNGQNCMKAFSIDSGQQDGCWEIDDSSFASVICIYQN
jgi:hypothetical protein